MRFWRVSIAVALVFGTLAHAHDVSKPAPSFLREYSQRVWRVPDGLPQNRIQAISQTNDGYLWIGTSGGLVRFDGIRFTIFDRSNTPAFRDDSILVLYPSRDGSLWIGAEGGGLLHYDGGTFTAYGQKDGLTNSFVRALQEDSDGVLWIGTDSGFFRKRGALIDRPDASAGLPISSITSMSISSMAADRAGTIWIGSDSGLLNVSNGKTQKLNSIGVRGLRRTRNGEIRAVAGGGIARIENDQVVHLPGLEGILGSALTDDVSGNLWIGTLTEGLLRRTADGAVERYTNALPSLTVLCIFADNQDNLWIGTGDGLVRMSRIAAHVLDSRDGLTDDNVWNVCEGRDGTPWLVTITGHLFRYARTGAVPVALPAAAEGRLYRTVYEDRQGGLWLGSPGQGITHIAGTQVRSYTVADGLRSNQIRQFLEDRRGNLWIGLGSGLARWDGSQFHNYSVEDGLSYGSVRILMEDSNGDLLVGTDAGLNRIRDGRFVRDPAFAPLENERIWSIHEDAAGALWIGTRSGGLYRIKRGKVSRITVHDGLISNAIYQVIDDGRGNLWMSGPRGVFFAPQRELDRLADGQSGPLSVVPYGAPEGLESTQMNGGFGPAGFRSPSGDMWFPSVRGAVRINADELRIARPSPVIIEGVVADGQLLPLTVAVTVAPGEGKLEIRYTASDLRSPERLSFRYRLEPFDNAWSPPTRDRTAYYTNLPPGPYKFRVVAVDTAAPTVQSEAFLEFTWRPHFYQTSWFYLLCGAMVALPGWIGFRIYARQTKKQYALRFAERTRIAREMHDTVIQGCAGVATLLEAASSFPPESTGRARELVEHARVQARLTLDEARQAVWDLRHTALEGDLSTVLGEFASQLSNEKGIPIESRFSGDAPPLEERAMRSILLVAREAIRNAANHANPGHIRLRVAFQSSEALLEVTDDGQGFTPSSRFGESGHYGIIGMRERIEQLGGEFVLRSAPGCGTTVIARLPLAGMSRRPEAAL